MNRQTKIMKPKISISIDVPDLKRAISFYTEALGCEVERDEEKMAVVVANNVSIYLLKKERDSNPLPAGTTTRSYERHWTPVHLDFIVPSIDEMVPVILELGGSHEGGESGDWGSIAYCADP